MQRKSEDICVDQINNTKYSLIFIGLLVLGILLAFVPLLFQVTPNKIGVPGSEARKFYTNPTVPNELRIYLFNLTNKDEVTKGAKPMLEEIGPYVFEEWMEKFDITDNDDDDTVEFNMKRTFIFRSDLSNGLTGNEKLTTIHALIMGMALNINVNRKPMLKLVSQAVNAIFHQPTDPFWTGRVFDYLFDGIEIDCTSEEFAAKATCAILGTVKTIQRLREGFYKFSVFGALNATGVGVYKVDRGIKNVDNVGRIVSFNKKMEMSTWDGECNRYRGTDSTIFPSGINKSDGLWIYEPELCMSLGARFDSVSKYKDVPTIRFGFDFGDVTKNHELQCYCSDLPIGCPRQGTINLFDCLDVPVVISLPHFYNADPLLLTESQSGLHPNEIKHSSYMEYEPITGSVVNAARRIQFNLQVVPVDDVECMKQLPAVVMPLFWLEQLITHDKNDFVPLMLQYQRLRVFLQILQWIAIVIGAIGIIYLLYNKHMRNTTLQERQTKDTD
ncbi:Sensory neuron membrane protein 1 [Pseudolycoriella hygida]|uniref:Sensory neuron membrane protein 1 n=1 Tax=Pseudolycoriella hygida TaxID=35572 RepID=A0A9Q0N4R3_9DIPT|nr:Sensory neuron membrane protein 1 [Pseudolycoriella hygida]